ncbi:MAG: class I SAM-dependent methyltransferase [Verrucomicrobia bacterium]|nr:class I SAM-dependent methyltransferase [Verrucomicrobiota bacterium]
MEEKDPRSLEQKRHHFEVEHELRERLLKSNRAERTKLFATLYGELFSRVPDHPRLLRRDTEEADRRATESRFKLLRGQLGGVKTFLEFAPGDCHLAWEVCKHVEKVIGVDISDQTGGKVKGPENFQLVCYDGYNLDVPDNSVDMVFSYQFLEHLHPEDVDAHFEMVKRILKPGGAYIFDTPHRYTGPHDISVWFSETPTGFHFQEWTFGGMSHLLNRIGFSGWFVYRKGKPRYSWTVNFLTYAVEWVFGFFPYKLRKALSRRLYVSVTMLVRK